MIMSKGEISKLRFGRLERGLSQQQLGFFADVSASDVSRIETRRMGPYEGQAERLARVLGLQPQELQEPAEKSDG